MIGPATAREERIKRTQALARRFASASILGRVGNRINWNLAVGRNERYGEDNNSFPVYAYRSNMHLRGYSDSVDNVPHYMRGKPAVAYRLNVFPKRGQPVFDLDKMVQPHASRLGSH